MKRGIFRITVINLICILCVFYFSFSIFNPAESLTVNKKEETTENVKGKIENNEETESITSKPEETSSKETEGKADPQAVETGASAKKGEIITQYNSPYSAPLSYDSVYMKNNTDLDISIKKYLEGKISFRIEKSEEPQVLILHTHATETFKTDDNPYFTEDFSSRSQDNSKNMVSVGKIVAEKLNNAGIKTIHDTTLHDYPSYTKSYSRAAATINEYLKKYPSIKVVLDLHRDAVSKENGDKVKLQTEIGGKKAAQVMLVMGSQSGGVTNFPNWEENFKLAVKLQQKIEQKYPTLARPLMLMSKNYNQSLTTGSLLIEFGTDVNTLEEVHYSAEMVGESLAELLSALQ